MANHGQFNGQTNCGNKADGQTNWGNKADGQTNWGNKAKCALWHASN
jgi:hypothetical protein